MSLSDKWLVQRVLAGNERAAEQLVKMLYPGVLRFLKHLTWSHEDALDLAQLTFVNIHRALPTFRMDCPLRPWTLRIAYREYLQWLSSRPQTLRLEEQAGLEAATASTDKLVLLQAIKDLEEPLRVCFWLHEVEQLSIREVAASLEIPEGTVKSRCHLARLELRKRLERTFNNTAAEVAAEVRNGS